MNLIRYPNEWLHIAVKDFDFAQMNAAEIETQMLAVMQQEQGVGLSANQVGLDAKIFVMQPHNQAKTAQPFAVINPQILKVSKESVLMEESCLSFPKLYLKITRPQTILVKYIDSKQKECIIELTGIDARIFLHEFDHLCGINIIDRVGKLKLEMALKKRNKLYT